jgi:hypothetical protein
MHKSSYCLVGALALALGLPGHAFAITILNFGQNSSANTVTALNDGASPNAVTTIAATDVAITIAGNNLGLSVGTQAYLTFAVASTGSLSVLSSGDLAQPFGGTFSIRSAVAGGGTNFLSGAFSDSVFGDGASLTLQASEPWDSVSFTSDIPGAPIAGPRGISWSFTNLVPLASQANNSLASFSASIAGNFTGTVPEPGTLGSFAVLSTAGLARRWRRR